MSISAAFRIIDIKLDSQTLPARGADIEIERHRAISDLLDDNSFRLLEPAAACGPYRLNLSLTKDHLAILAICTATDYTANISLPLAELKRHIADYVIVCDTFYKTARAGEFHRLEAIDAGRRSIHNEAAELLQETLENKVILDKATARRLFTLLYVLHMRSTPAIV